MIKLHGVLCGLAAVVLALAVGCSSDSRKGVGSGETYPDFRVPVYWVIPADSPDMFQISLGDEARQNIWVCDGTQSTGGDQVELQAANAAAFAAGGGTIRVPTGTLYVSKPGDAVDVSITSCTITKDTPNSTSCRLSVLVFGGGADIDDVVIGQSYRLSGGDDGAGADRTIEDNEEELVGTVTAVDDPADTITLWGSFLNNYTAAAAVRLIPAFSLDERVSLIGDGLRATTIKLANEQDCDVVHVFEESASNALYARIQDLSINGNKTQQGDKVASNWNGECNGLVVNAKALDCYFQRMSVEDCKGDGIWDTSRWGNRYYGGWIETNIGTGFVVATYRQITVINGLKATGNGTGLWLRKAKGVLVSKCQFEPDNLDGATDNNAIRLTNAATENMFTGNWIGSSDATAGATAHAVYLKSATRNTFSGNFFNVDGTKNVFYTPYGAVNYVTNNVIASNTCINSTTAPFHDLIQLAHTGNIVRNNNIAAAYERDSIWCKNTSGGTLNVGDVVIFSTAATNTSGNEITTTTIAGDGNVAGMVEATIADDGWGTILRLGKTTRLKVDGTDDIAVGDLLSTFTTAKIAQKAATGEVAFAKALEAYATNDSAGVIDALLITPRQME